MPAREGRHAARRRRGRGSWRAVRARRRRSFSATRLWTVAAQHARRDVVYADQRGTGGSNPLLCQFYGPPDQPQRTSTAFLPHRQGEGVPYASSSATSDLRQYTTSASVEDLEAIRSHSATRSCTLVGGSYGTRLAMEYVRRYEARVRAVVLEGPVTPANHVPGALRPAGRARARRCARRMPCGHRLRARVSRDPGRSPPGVRAPAAEAGDRRRLAPIGAAAGDGHVDARPRRRGDSLHDLLVARGLARAVVSARGVQAATSRRLPAS